jgi:tetratricopeptide (TPR) repeat protein
MRDEIQNERGSKHIGKWPSSFTDPLAHIELCQSMIPPELLNNLAVLLMEINKNSEAKKLLEEALQNCETLQLKGDPDDKRLRALKITTQFNFACSLESENKIGEASEIFKQLIKEEPSYTDAYVKLAYLARRRGDLNRAIEYIDVAKKSAIQKPPFSKPVNLCCIKAKLLVD